MNAPGDAGGLPLAAMDTPLRDPSAGGTDGPAVPPPSSPVPVPDHGADPSSTRACEGERLLVEILFPPNATRLALQARAVKITPRPDGGYDLKADFAAIPAEDQEFLIQYIMRRQTQLLQAHGPGRGRRRSSGPSARPFLRQSSRRCLRHSSPRCRR